MVAGPAGHIAHPVIEQVSVLDRLDLVTIVYKTPITSAEFAPVAKVKPSLLVDARQRILPTECLPITTDLQGAPYD